MIDRERVARDAERKLWWNVRNLVLDAMRGTTGEYEDEIAHAEASTNGILALLEGAAMSDREKVARLLREHRTQQSWSADPPNVDYQMADRILALLEQEPVEETLYTMRCGWCGAYEGTVDPAEPCARDHDTGEYIGPHQFGVEKYVLVSDGREGPATERELSDVQVRDPDGDGEALERDLLAGPSDAEDAEREQRWPTQQEFLEAHADADAEREELVKDGKVLKDRDASEWADVLTIVAARRERDGYHLSAKDYRRAAAILRGE